MKERKQTNAVLQSPFFDILHQKAPNGKLLFLCDFKHPYTEPENLT